jgi:hypothetical protein
LNGVGGRRLVEKPYSLRKIVRDSRGGYQFPTSVYADLKKKWAQGLDRLFYDVIDKKIDDTRMRSVLAAALRADRSGHAKYAIPPLREAIEAYMKDDYRHLPAGTVKGGWESIRDALESDMLRAFERAKEFMPLREDDAVATTVTFEYE